MPISSYCIISGILCCTIQAGSLILHLLAPGSSFSLTKAHTHARTRTMSIYLEIHMIMTGSVVGKSATFKSYCSLCPLACLPMCCLPFLFPLFCSFPLPTPDANYICSFFPLSLRTQGSLLYVPMPVHVYMRECLCILNLEIHCTKKCVFWFILHLAIS